MQETRRNRNPPADPPAAGKPSRLQMADLARLANVSVSTVSRALANHPRLSEETRTRIQELARSLNYAADAGAQMLRGKRLNTVAVAFPYHPEQRQHFRDPFFLALIGRIGDALIDRGYSMLVVGVEASQFERITAAYDTRQAIGTILLGQESYHQRINELAVRGVPFVVWGARLRDQLYCTVGSDNLLGGRLATEHLLAAGARRIAFFGDPSLSEIGQRHEGWLAAQRDRGIEPDPRLVRPMPFEAAAAHAEVERLLGEAVPFDAVFAASDGLALGALAALKSRGLRVPDDVQLVGFDDMPAAAQASPALTTVRQDLEAAGRGLVELLLAALAGQAIEPLILPTRLVARESTRHPG